MSTCFISRTLSSADLGLPYACASVSVLVHMYIDPVDFKVLISWVFFIFPGSYTLSTSFSIGFFELWEEEFDGDIIFSTGFSNVLHFLHNI